MTTSSARIKVLVVDDSVVIRRLVSDALASDPEIEVVGSAPNGRVAIERVQQLAPDAVTMDIEMPEMNGIDAVRAIRRTHPRLPIVMFSTLTERGAAATLDALAAGASDYVAKPSNVGSFAESQANVREQLIPKLKALCGTRRAVQARIPSPPTPRRESGGAFSLLVIGCSTGGPDALAQVLPTLPADLPVPVLVVQHMPPHFTRLLAQRLDGVSKLRISEAETGDRVLPGRVLIAPGGRHLVVARAGGALVARLTDDPPENFCRPAVDVMFRSAAALAGVRVLGVVLTGMGRDGEKGARLIRDAGGEVFAQDQATSVVWGMPGAVAGSGQADRVVALQQVGPEIVGAVMRNAAPSGVRT